MEQWGQLNNAKCRFDALRLLKALSLSKGKMREAARTLEWNAG
jgi:hypothetical protein